jgi:hypothetical protein
LHERADPKSSTLRFQATRAHFLRFSRNTTRAILISLERGMIRTMKSTGHYTPLFAQAASEPTVLYDEAINQFLMVYNSAWALYIQASPNLLKWPGTPLTNGTINASPNVLGYPTLVGEGRNPHVGGLNPYLFYLNTVPPFPHWNFVNPDGTSGANYVSRQIHISLQ